MMQHLSKVWIPEYHTEYRKDGSIKRTQLWIDGDDENDMAITSYIKSRDVPNPEEALRFSKISNMPEKLQMVIPPKTISNSKVDFWAECWDSKEELKRHRSITVDWTAWGIKGDPNPAYPEYVPEPEPSGSSNEKESWSQWLLDCIEGLCTP
jgi:hypothetical protein